VLVSLIVLVFGVLVARAVARRAIPRWLAGRPTPPWVKRGEPDQVLPVRLTRILRYGMYPGARGPATLAVELAPADGAGGAVVFGVYNGWHDYELLARHLDSVIELQLTERDAARLPQAVAAGMVALGPAQLVPAARLLSDVQLSGTPDAVRRLGLPAPPWLRKARPGSRALPSWPSGTSACACSEPAR
jgi:hypothetical protein